MGSDILGRSGISEHSKIKWMMATMKNSWWMRSRISRRKE